MKSGMMKEKSRTIVFKIIQYVRKVCARTAYESAPQILRPGTGIGTNVETALPGVSHADTIAKMPIASGESRKTHYRLRLLRARQSFEPII